MWPGSLWKFTNLEQKRNSDPSQENNIFHDTYLSPTSRDFQ